MEVEGFENSMSNRGRRNKPQVRKRSPANVPYRRWKKPQFNRPRPRFQNNTPVIRRDENKVRMLQGRMAKLENLEKGGFKLAASSAPVTEKKEDTWWESALGVAGSIAKAVGPAIIAGLGDYTIDEGPIKSNSIVAGLTNGAVGGQVPEMRNDSGLHQTHHREYLGDLLSNTDFNIASFDINPGLTNTFPWCAPIANQYQSYKLKGAMVEFVSLSSQYTSNTYLGYVAMAPIYNVSAPLPHNKSELNNTNGSISEKPTKSMIMGLECAPERSPLKEYFVRGDSQTAPVDIKFYDTCKIVIAVGGQPTSGAVLGEIWISYDVQFFDPISTGNELEGKGAHYKLGAGVTGAAPFTGMVQMYDNLGINLVAANQINWSLSEVGQYFVVDYILAGASAVLSYNTQTGTGIGLQVCWFNDSTIAVNLPATGATSTSVRMTCCLRITAATWFLQLNTTTLPGATTSGDVVIYQVDEKFIGAQLEKQMAEEAKVLLRGPIITKKQQNRLRNYGMWDDRKTLITNEKFGLVPKGKKNNSIPLLKNPEVWETPQGSDSSSEFGEPDVNDLQLQLILVTAQLAGTDKLQDVKKVLKESNWDMMDALIQLKTIDEVKKNKYVNPIGRTLLPCVICRDPQPDHIGRDCPARGYANLQLNTNLNTRRTLSVESESNG
jgi:hypothetical protein